MADRLAELFQDTTLRHSLGENARLHMQEHFSPKHFLDSFQQLVEAVSR